MSNEENKITTVEKTITKVKDPRKVELGKRLAKISKEAKLRKKQRLQMEEEKNKEILDYIDFRYVVGGVMLLVAVGGLYFVYKKDKREIKEEKVIEVEENKSPVKKNNNYTKQTNKCNIENL